jgi:hypothetical protein
VCNFSNFSKTTRDTSTLSSARRRHLTAHMIAALVSVAPIRAHRAFAVTRARAVARRSDACDGRSLFSGDSSTRISQDIDADAAFVAGMVRFWLDEEWQFGAQINEDIGQAAGKAYADAQRAMAAEGDEEEVLQRLVMSIAGDLMAFDFSDSFVSAFEVANKVIEMLMLRAGSEVCCVSEEDITREARYLASLETPP